jgi:hypothetical protein
MRLNTVFASLLLAGILLNAAPVWGVEDVQVNLDGRTILFDVAPLMIGDRAIVPIRAIAENLGATVGWDENLRRVDLYLGNRYVFLTLQANEMIHGTYRSDAYGNFLFVTQHSVELETAPYIRSGHVLAPVRALLEGLGASVRWDPNSRVVFINSPSQQFRDLSAPVPDTSTWMPEKLESNYLRKIAAEQAQNWYATQKTFLLFFFSEMDASSVQTRKWIYESARERNLLVYAVDRDSTQFDNSHGPTFVWQYLDPHRVNQMPALFFIHGGDARVIVQPKSRQMIEDMLINFQS